LPEAYLSATTGSHQNNLLRFPNCGCTADQPCRVSVAVANYTEPANSASLNGPLPDTALINGGNNWNCTNNSTNRAGGRFQATVLLNKLYRLRVISTGASLSLMFSIDGHEFQIIETDGNDVNTSFNEPQAA
jgi:FtsP/CotA-like multicopper oxidase with cupredoxin domain